MKLGAFMSYVYVFISFPAPTTAVSVHSCAILNCHFGAGEHTRYGNSSVTSRNNMFCLSCGVIIVVQRSKHLPLKTTLNTMYEIDIR